MDQSDRTTYRESVNDHFDYLFPYPASENDILGDAEREFISNGSPIPHELFDVSNWLCREEDTISVRALATLKATAIENAAIAEEADSEGEAIRLVEGAVSKEGSEEQTDSATSIQKSVPLLTAQAMASVAEMWAAYGSDEDEPREQAAGPDVDDLAPNNPESAMELE